MDKIKMKGLAIAPMAALFMFMRVDGVQANGVGLELYNMQNDFYRAILRRIITKIADPKNADTQNNGRIILKSTMFNPIVGNTILDRQLKQLLSGFAQLSGNKKCDLQIAVRYPKVEESIKEKANDVFSNLQKQVATLKVDFKLRNASNPSAKELDLANAAAWYAEIQCDRTGRSVRGVTFTNGASIMQHLSQ